MHVKYPRQKGFFTWEELGCLAKALGYQKKLFYTNIPPEYHKEKIPGLNTKTLLVIMDMKVLHGDLHRTYNMHDALYNSRVIEKAIDMLSNKYLSFQELREVRVAFQLYEHEDMMGLFVDEQILLRTLKACGRSVSPMKVMQHIKHTKTHVQDRLMLYEFLELLLLCERDSDVIVPSAPQVSGVDPRNNLYNICDFKSILVPQDEKKITQLNSAYEQGLMKPGFARKSQTQPSWRELQPFLVDLQPRIELVGRHQQRTVELADHLNHSNKKVMNARCGRTARQAGRPFVDLNDVVRTEKRNHRVLQTESPLYDVLATGYDVPSVTDRKENEPSRVAFSSPSPPKEHQTTPDRPTTTDSQEYLKTYSGTTPQKLSRMSRTRERQILVTPRDVHNATAKIENLNWDIETQSVRQKRKTDKYLQEKFPQQYQLIRQRVEKRQNSENPFIRRALPLDQPNIIQEEKSSDEPTECPRRNSPTRDNIYTNLKSRLQSTNTLLDYGDVEVPYSPFSKFLSKQLEKKRPQEDQKDFRFGPRTLKVENLGALPGEEDLRRTAHDHNDGEVLELLETFQEANFVASGRSGTSHEKHEWKHTSFV